MIILYIVLLLKKNKNRKYSKQKSRKEYVRLTIALYRSPRPDGVFVARVYLDRSPGLLCISL